MNNQADSNARFIRWACLFAPAVLILLLSGSLFSQSTQEEDKAAIRALVDKINRAWRLDKPSILFQEVLSDKGFAVAMPKPNNPSEALVIDKQRFCELLDNMMQAQQGPQKHEHTVESITVIGPLAYEIGISLDVRTNGIERRDEVINVFAKDDTGWKLIYSTFAGNIRKALALLASDEQEVRDLAQEFAALFQPDNPEPFTRLNQMLAEDFFAVTSKGNILQDKASALRAYRKAWQQTRSTFEALKIRYDIQSIKAADHGAVVFGMLEIDGRLKDNNGPFRKEVWETLILQRIDGQWQIAQEHSTTVAKTDASNGKWIEGTR